MKKVIVMALVLVVSMLVMASVASAERGNIGGVGTSSIVRPAADRPILPPQ